MHAREPSHRGPGFNLFVATHGGPPTLRTNALERITRRTVFDLAHGVGTSVREAELVSDHLCGASVIVVHEQSHVRAGAARRYPLVHRYPHIADART